MLYGRFGMSPDMSTNLILTHDEAEKYHNDFEVTDTIDFFNGMEMIEFINEKGIDDTSRDPNISVSISAAVTAYSRITMCEYKHIPGNPPLYSDTDSVALELPLPSEKIGQGLGQMKLEYIFSKAVFLAPKVYGGILDPKTSSKVIAKKGPEIVKVKGLKNPVSYFQLESLLYKNNKLLVDNEKWYRHFDHGYISISKEIYTLTVTANKREIIYDSNGLFVNTKPFELKMVKL